MSKRTYTQYCITFSLLGLMMCLLFLWNINSGSVHLTVGEIGKILIGQTDEGTAYHIAVSYTHLNQTRMTENSPVQCL